MSTTDKILDALIDAGFVPSPAVDQIIGQYTDPLDKIVERLRAALALAEHEADCNLCAIGGDCCAEYRRLEAAADNYTNEKGSEVDA